ncbi:hypothetical protein [Neorhodopirellula pilleata]|nr:hypothetical protein [Neorhodopirellula pilleata]
MFASRWLSFACAVCTAASPVLAGVTGENVAVVVNAASIDSITVANHYVSLRHVPANNVIWLDDVPEGNSVSLNDFRDRILKPLLEKINAKQIAAQIQVVAYSAGFPTAVQIGEHTKRLTDPNQKKYQTPTASINSLTYFYRFVLSDSSDYLGWASNQYARGRFARHFVNPFAGEKRKQFTAAESAARDGDHTRAAESFEALADEYPTLSPLHILAAEHWLAADEELKALQQLDKAVASGWADRRHLTESDTFRDVFNAEDPDSLSPRKQRLLDAMEDVPVVNQGPMPFAAALEWTASGHPVPPKSGAIPYLLSCVLAVVHPNGNTLDEAIAVLQLAAKADHTFPNGVFGFAKTADVRVTTREPLYGDAIAWLLSRKQDVEIFPSSLPDSDKTYVGMMLGSAGLSLESRKWSFAPGALAENLTSLGGAFETKSQTKLTELLSAGAAISSGAVAEPYALVPKFPTPMIYPYYCEGVTAIEAFYLSVTSPYQLLIVGDPICQPFARPPNDLIRIETAPQVGTQGEPKTAPQPSAIEVHWQALPDSPVSSPVAEFQLYVLGKLFATAPPVPNMKINLPDELAGMVDCRVVMTGRHPTRPAIATRAQLKVGGDRILPKIQRLRKQDQSRWTVFVDCPGADRMEVMHLGRTIAEFDGDASRLTFTPEKIGNGPVRLQAIAYQGEQTIFGDVFQSP